jgi:hypothetical protein
MAAASIGLSLSVRGSRSIRDRSNYVLRYNLESNYNFTTNKHGGKDVNLRSLGKIVTSFSDVNVAVILIDKEFLTDTNSTFADMLQRFDQSKGEHYVIAEFRTNTGSHFAILDGIAKNSEGDVILNYREQYDGFRGKKFTIADILSLRVVIPLD